MTKSLSLVASPRQLPGSLLEASMPRLGRQRSLLQLTLTLMVCSFRVDALNRMPSLPRRAGRSFVSSRASRICALHRPSHAPSFPRRASRSFASSRLSRIVCSERDDFILYGDCAVLLGYGLIQGIVDVSFSGLQSTQPELFDLLVGPPVALPSLQVTLLTALWLATGIALGGVEAFDPFDIKKTRGVDPVTAAATPFAPWVATFLVVSVVLSGLDGAFQLGPGLSEAELNFLVGAYVVVAGWRVVVNSLLPPI